VATLRSLLADDTRGLRVLEVPLDRASRRPLTEALTAVAHRALS